MASYNQPTELGDCPECGTTITDVAVLIEYETADGESAYWADCPDCGAVVDPTR
jgi:predicted RNA-binding Zn-ribbon protein involved in translation (DUF1610 family)